MALRDDAIEGDVRRHAGQQPEYGHGEPRIVGVIRDGAIALVEPTPEGLRMLGTPGWRMGEVMGVLVEKDGRHVFQAKHEVVDATAERVAAVQRLKADLEALMSKG